MKLRLLNPEVSNEVFTIKLITSPWNLKLNSENKLSEEGEVRCFASVVYCKDLVGLYVLEYNQHFLNSFLGYRRRNGNSNRFSVLIQRGRDGKMVLSSSSDFALPDHFKDLDLLNLKNGVSKVYENKLKSGYIPYEFRNTTSL